MYQICSFNFTSFNVRLKLYRVYYILNMGTKCVYMLVLFIFKNNNLFITEKGCSNVLYLTKQLVSHHNAEIGRVYKIFFVL